MNKFFFKDSSGQKSVTVTVFIWGALAVNIKLLLGGMTLAGTVVPAFGGGDYAAAMAALGAIYVMRRNSADKAKKEEVK